MLKTIANTANSLLDTVSGQRNQYSATKELQNAKDIQKMYSDAINTQYAAGIQNLQNQEKTLALQYDPQRALVNSNYERGVQNNAEQMANLGLTRSGTNLTAQLALETERQRGLAEVNSAQDAARRDLQAQINEYIAQRDSEIAKQSASIYQNAYDNISSYERQLAQMEKQHGYDKELAEQGYAHDKEMAAISNEYNKQMAVLEYEHSLALANNNYDREAEIKREMAALEQEYTLQIMNRQAEIDRQLYSDKAAIDASYKTGEQSEGESNENENEPNINEQSLGELAILATFNYGFSPSTKKFGSQEAADSFKTTLDELVNTNRITSDEYIYLLNYFNY